MYTLGAPLPKLAPLLLLVLPLDAGGAVVCSLDPVAASAVLAPAPVLLPNASYDTLAWSSSADLICQSIHLTWANKSGRVQIWP